MSSEYVISLDDPAPIATSFPSFNAMMRGLGAEIG